jgi:hypothetical protein
MQKSINDSDYGTLALLSSAPSLALRYRLGCGRRRLSDDIQKRLKLFLPFDDCALKDQDQVAEEHKIWWKRRLLEFLIHQFLDRSMYVLCADPWIVAKNQRRDAKTATRE